jgi:hypothetical protein
MAATAANSRKAAWKKIVETAFIGNKGIKFGNPDVLLSAGAPTTAAKVGTLCWDYTNSHPYICTVISGTWVKLIA